MTVAPASARLLFCGDTHGSLDHLIELARAHPAHQLIHVGDLAPLAAPLEQLLPDDVAQRFWFIPGNHDFDEDADIDRLLGSALAARNLHGQVHEIAGLRIAGLGGHFLGRVWYPRGERPAVSRNRAQALQRLSARERWRGGLSRRLRAAIYPDELEALRQQQADVLVCHEAPGSHRFGFRVLDELALAMGCQLVVHGHQHEDYQSHLPGSRVRAIGVGLRGVTDFNGRVLRPGE